MHSKLSLERAKEEEWKSLMIKVAISHLVEEIVIFIEVEA
jgi:hypothetical protein